MMTTINIASTRRLLIQSRLWVLFCGMMRAIVLVE
jgi:hypothetical protein